LFKFRKEKKIPVALIMILLFSKYFISVNLISQNCSKQWSIFFHVLTKIDLHNNSKFSAVLHMVFCTTKKFALQCGGLRPTVLDICANFLQLHWNQEI
jgi:hypothetical protein